VTLVKGINEYFDADGYLAHEVFTHAPPRKIRHRYTVCILQGGALRLQIFEHDVHKLLQRFDAVMAPKKDGERPPFEIRHVYTVPCVYGVYHKKGCLYAHTHTSLQDTSYMRTVYLTGRPTSGLYHARLHKCTALE
jgi:hypothetical protein